jgi:hypothetical protein
VVDGAIRPIVQRIQSIETASNAQLALTCAVSGFFEQTQIPKADTALSHDY